MKQFFDQAGEGVGSDAFNAALNVLEAKAAEEGRRELETRCFKESDGRLIIDMTNQDEQVAVITPEGWSLETLEEPRFRRYAHMLPMDVSDDVADLRNFVKFWRLKDPEDDVLLVGWIGHAFVAGIPHAILVAMGPKGSTKTSMQRAVRKLVDPSSLEDMTMADRGNEIVQQLSHHYIPLFDNVSRLQAWQADDLCRASTGAGFTKRSLYTDEDDVIFRFRRVVMLNGINTPTHRGDFLDRALLLECSRVPTQERMEDSAIQAKVLEWLPGLRRTIFDSLVFALGNLEQVREELKELPRMADFAIWGEAFCRGIGYAPLEFYNRLMAKTNEASFIALENDPIAELISKLFDDRTAGQQYLTGSFEFEGTASQLLGVLQHLNEDIKHVSKRELPSSPEALSRHLGDIAADLEESGIKVLRRKTTGGKRVLSVSKLPPEGSKSAPLPPLPPLGKGANDGQSGASGGSGTEVLTSPGEGKPTASIKKIVCSVEGCGIELGSSGPGKELSVYKIGKGRYCKAHYLEKTKPGKKEEER